VKKPIASANGRRWSARGFFYRKSHFDLRAVWIQTPVAIHPGSSEPGILAFSREISFPKGKGPWKKS
jgi:hypothetical protein